MTCLMWAAPAWAQAPRERINIDDDWAFALGHATDTARDFNYATAPFFFAKAGYGDGPASARYDDRAWRRLSLPHDWAVELSFDSRADGNHGSRAIGRNFPENSIGWYRKTLTFTQADVGRRVSVEFDGVYRDSEIWFNGHYLGNEHSGYSSFRYDLTDYINYAGPNVLVVRADATREEGWFYEGAGIYRHVWLTKTDPLHVEQWGVFVSSEVRGEDADLSVQTSLLNEGDDDRSVQVEEQVVDRHGLVVATHSQAVIVPAHGATALDSQIAVEHAQLWSLEDPALYRLVTTIRDGAGIVDRYETSFGIRTVRWDADTGFWLNGRNIKLEGTNNHQDHAGIGAALPDSMQEYRLRRLLAMGSNAYRASHNPPTPELLEAADRLGMLVINEHRMMGTTPEIRDQLERLIRRDRNHPSVIIWSVGNEEWAIENGELGARLTRVMQDQVRRLDPSRRVMVAMAGGTPGGSSTTTDVLGFNYRSQHDVDRYHALFPNTPTIMSEEGSTTATRGVYVTDRAAVHLAAYDTPQRPTGTSSIQQGWTAVAERPWMSGMFVWTGFDYRGETTPFGWPAISSQFGMLDTTGLFKDTAYYLRAWWDDTPTLHILPHWTWPDRVGEPIDVWVYSNAEEVELSLNGRSLGRQTMTPNAHLEWTVPYEPGRLTAIGYRDGRRVSSGEVRTAGAPAAIALEPDRTTLLSDDVDTVPVLVSVRDRRGDVAPLANDLVEFSISGPGRIIGVGNGDPGSHEPDQSVERIDVSPVGGWRITALSHPGDAGAAEWRDPFQWFPPGSEPAPLPAYRARGSFRASALTDSQEVTLFLMPLATGQKVFVNEVDVSASSGPSGAGMMVTVPIDLLRVGENVVEIHVADDGPASLARMVGVGAQNVASVRLRTPPAPWRRRVFNGYAQVLIQSTGSEGDIVLTAQSPDLRTTRVTLTATKTQLAD
ncbi:beta-galactosidase GalA [Brevundimonas sp.]|uniref:beta-galactosidase GalA n=1 Tax=Brevundimonas sp. TaxID=1871086 RepID=UPI002D5937A4|nr:beta-galactosidase GalA [Brevundimonas sp.]HYC99374.1 beta-galactosidase GalA [Brevundimonas sp.]